MDNRIDGVVLSVMNEIGGFAGNTTGMDEAGRAPARKEKTGSKAAARPRSK
jgi:hypothetical protein